MAKNKVLIAGLTMTLTAGAVLAAYQRLVQPKYMSDAAAWIMMCCSSATANATRISHR